MGGNWDKSRDHTDVQSLNLTASLTKKTSGLYETHQASTKKIVSFSEESRKWMSLAFKFTENGKKVYL